MRNLLRTTLVLLAGISLHVAGCAEPTTPGTGGAGGDGGTAPSGGGGAGGSDCVEEICDGQDNDCDGVVDEGCECLPGDTEACYTGPAGTADVGTCKSGVRTCDPATNTFGPCVGEVHPAAQEQCDGLDEDCTGTADDGLAPIVCGIGACMSSVPACDNGQPGTCVPGQPSQEVCDGVDNDCDQLTDEAFPESGTTCDTGLLGVCQAGTVECHAGRLVCVGLVQAGNEICDGLDNDCDGTPDNNIPGTGGACSTGALGVCAAGQISCQGGVVDCFPAVPASPEVCDGLDNDCDGQTDEMNPQGGDACDTGQLAACQQGTVMCVAGKLECTPNASAQVEICDGLDNNCDGQSDEGNPGAGQMCSCGGTTVCQAGLLYCQNCTKEVTCNDGLDDDNDGAVDCSDLECALGCDPSVPQCPAGQTLLVLSSTDVPKAIVDNASVQSTITFTEVGTVKRVVLQIDITHSFDGDLDISLKSPDNTIIDVTSDNGGLGDNYTNTIFNDGCTPVESGSAPFSGCYSPEQALGTFVDKQLNGTWTLVVADDASSDNGTLHAWRLAMCVQ